MYWSVVLLGGLRKYFMFLVLPAFCLCVHPRASPPGWTEPPRLHLFPARWSVPVARSTWSVCKCDTTVRSEREREGERDQNKRESSPLWSRTARKLLLLQQKCTLHQQVGCRDETLEVMPGCCESDLACRRVQHKFESLSWELQKHSTRGAEI